MSDKISSQEGLYKEIVNPLTGEITFILVEERRSLAQQREQVKLRLSSCPLYQAMAAKYKGYWDISSKE